MGEALPRLRVPFETGNKTSFGSIQKNVCFGGCFGSTPKQRISVFRLNQNKQKSYRNSLIENIFFLFFSENLGLFRFVLEQFVLFLPKQRVSMFRLNRNKQKTNRKSSIESIFRYFSESLGCFGLFQNSSVFLSCFEIGSKHRNKPKFLFWVSRN